MPLPPLTAEQQSLASQWSGLPVYVVNRWYRRLNESDREEALGVASLALVEAAARYDETKGVQFNTYAVRCLWYQVRSWLDRVKAHNTAGYEEFDESTAVDKSADMDAAIDAGEAVEECLAALTDRERRVILARFGFGRPAMGLLQIAKAMGVIRERVRQIEMSGIQRMRRVVG